MTSPIDTAYVEIKPDSRGFTRDTKRDVDRALRDVERDVSRSMSRIKNAIGSIFGAITGAAKAIGTVVLLATKFTALAAAAGAVAVALTGLASAVGGGIQMLIGLVQVATQAAGALLLIPGAIAILGSAFATIKIGIGGIGQAFKEAGAAAGGGGAAIEGAERRIALAQREAKAAQEALTQARKDAKENIEDLARTLKGARLDEEAAIIALEDAQRALTAAQRSGDPDAIRRADLAYRQAQQSLEDVQDRVGDLADENEEANKKGVEGSDAVQAALQRQADAAYNLAQAQKAATASAGGMASAFSKLAPNAQEFVRAILALKPAFDSLRLDVQNALFKDMGAAVTNLAHAQLPVLHTGLTAIAREINTVLIVALRELSTEAAKADFASIFRSTATVIHNLGNAVAPLLHALRDIVTVSAEAVAALTGGLDEWAERFAKKIGDMRASGELRKLIDDGIQAVKLLVGLLGDVLGIIKGIAKAAGGTSGIFGFFDRLNKLVNSTKGQNALANIFKELARLGDVLTPVLFAVLKALGPIAKGIADIAEAFAPVLEILAGQLGDALASLAPGFIALVPAVASLGKSLAPLAKILVDLVVAAGPGLAAMFDGLAAGLTALAPAAAPVGRALGAIFAALGPLLQALGAILAPLLTTLALLLTNMLSVLTPIIQVFADMATAVANELLPPLLELAQEALPRYAELGVEIAKAFKPLIPQITKIAKIIADKLLEVLPQMIQFFEDLTPVLIDVAEAFSAALLKILIEKILPKLPDLLDAFFDMAIAFGEILLEIAPLIPPLVDLALTVLDLAANSGVLIPLIKITTQALRLFLDAVKLIITPLQTVMGIVEKVGSKFGLFGKDVDKGMGIAEKAVKDSVSTIKGTLKPLGSTGQSVGESIGNALAKGLRSRQSFIQDAARAVAGAVVAAANAVLEIHSPSRVFMRIGQQTVRGMALGMKNAAPSLVNELEGIMRNDVTNVAGQTNIDQSVNFNNGSINMRFNGDANQQTAQAAGMTTGRSIADALARRRSVRVAVRTA